MRTGVVLLVGAALLAPGVRAQTPTERVSFHTADGVLLAGSFYPTANRLAPAVVLVHMLTRNRRDWEPVAMRLTAQGIAALTFEK